MTQQSKPPKKSFRLIGQGTYGCAIHPGFNCTTKRFGSNEYISKLQIEDETTKSEIEMGKIIKKIPNHQFYFAPILEQCQVNASLIDGHQLEQCQVVAKSNKKNIVSNKIRYIGSETFGKYFYEVLDKKSPSIYLQKILESHIYLLKSIQILNSNGLLHLDIKENNVIYDNVNDVFILIDFGFCIESKKIELANYMQSIRPFGKIADSYSPWCIEIILLSYISKYIQDPKSPIYKINDSIFQQKIIDTNTRELKRRCTLFIKKNSLFETQFFSNNEIQEFETALHKWVDGFKGKTWKDVWTILVSSHKSWDNYSLSVMYLLELYDSNIIEQRMHAGLIHNYMSILNKIILVFPENRSLAKVTAKEIEKNFVLLDKNMVNEFTKMAKLAQSNIKTVKERKNKRTLRELEEDSKLLSNHQNVLQAV